MWKALLKVLKGSHRLDDICNHLSNKNSYLKYIKTFLKIKMKKTDCSRETSTGITWGNKIADEQENVLLFIVKKMQINVFVR